MSRLRKIEGEKFRAKIRMPLLRGLLESIKGAMKATHLTVLSDECKTHLCFEFISHAILRILYPCSCKTHNISSKLGFVGLLMKSK